MKHIRSLLALTSILFLTLYRSAHAQTVSPNPAPTIITTVPYTISKPGFYQLGANLVGTSITGNLITIATDNVILDFAGHSISGPADPSTQLNGVYADKHNNLTVQNGKISFCFTAIYIQGNSNNLIERVQNMVIAHCLVGLDLDNVSVCNVADNRFCFMNGSPEFANSLAIIVEGTALGVRISNNDFTSITGFGVQTSNQAVYEIGNTFSSVTTSIQGGKYANNLTSNSGAPTGGVDAGGNN